MADRNYTNKAGEIRFYDGTTPTPFYLKIVFDKGDFSGPMGRPQPDEKLNLERENMTDNANYVQLSDQKMMDPLEVAFSTLMGALASQGYLRDWLHGRTVNGNTIVTTKGTTKNDGVHFNPTFANANRLCCNVEIKWAGDSNLVEKYNEVEFPLDQQNISESGEEVPLALKGQCYGTIVDTDSDFTTGTDVTT